MKLYHASQHHNLHKRGIVNSEELTCGRFHDGYVYLGSMKYLEEQYFQYCPKGTYYIFEVNLPENFPLEYLEKVDHYRYSGNIDAKYVEPYRVKIVR